MRNNNNNINKYSQSSMERFLDTHDDVTLFHSYLPMTMDTVFQMKSKDSGKTLKRYIDSYQVESLDNILESMYEELKEVD